MKKSFIKPLSLILCAALLAGGAGVYALNSGKLAEEAAEESAAEAAAETAAEKDETVYVLAGADGSVKKIIVSDWIKNTAGSALLSDKSELSGVENVKGGETYTMNGDNMRIWDADGNDIYCQGNIEKELPVKLSVSYKLDGKPISAEELAGKSGRVTVRFDYRNNQYETVSIDGKEEKIYVPFVMATGVLLDGDAFKNVEVSNGKLINDGSRIAVAGLALPGLKENLASDKLDIPDYVEITAQTEKFEMTNTVTIATNEVFSAIDTSELDSAEELTASLDQLNDAMGKLLDGSSELYGGLCTLLDKSGELIAGIDKLADGAAKLRAGAGTLGEGASALSDGTKELTAGLSQLAANNSVLNGGAKQVFDSLLAMADTQLAAAGLSVTELTPENYSEVLNGVIASLDAGKVQAAAEAAALKKVTEAVNAQKETVKAGVSAEVRKGVSAKVTAAVRGEVETKVLAGLGMTKEQYESGVAAGAISKEVQEQFAAAMEAQMSSDEVAALIEKNTSAQMNSAEITALIESQTGEQIKLLIEQNMASAEVRSQIAAAIEKAKAGLQSITALKAQLDSYNEFYTGLKQYTAGVDAAKNGADSLSAGAGRLDSGAAELYAGISELYDGILTVKNGAPALTGGVTALRDGAMQLSGGLKEFNEKGVSKLTEAVNGGLKELVTRFRATCDVSKRYRSFSGISDEIDGQVKFIYRTDAVYSE